MPQTMIQMEKGSKDIKIATAKQDETGVATTTKEEETGVEEASALEEEESAIQIRRME